MNKVFSLSVLTSLALATAGLQADVMTVSVGGFGDPTTFTNLDSSLNLRVTELVPASGTNLSTHVLIEGLSPLEPETMNYSSTYSGINVDSGETQDVGILYLQMPEGSSLPEGTVASPIVGVVQRSGSWSDYSIDLPETSVGGSSGSGDYGTGTLSMTLNRGMEVFMGTTTYTVLDTDTIEIEPFTLTIDGGGSVDLSGATLLRDGGRYYGTLTNLSEGAAYDSLLFSMEFNNIPDVDSDGIPDIADDSITPSGLTPNAWNLTDIGYVWGYTNQLGYSIFMGYVYMQMPYIYHYSFGWLYLGQALPQDVGTIFWFYSQSLGWVYVNDTYGGFFQAEAKGWAWNNFLSPSAW